MAMRTLVTQDRLTFQRFILAIVIVTTLVALLALQVTLPRVLVNPEGHQIDLWEKNKRHDLYNFNGTNVGLLHGNIFELNDINGLEDASVAFSTKSSKAQPYVDDSVHSQFNKLITKGDTEILRSLTDAVTKLVEAHSTENVWADALPDDWLLNGRRVFLAAGIRAPLSNESEHTKALVRSNTLKSITPLVQKLCNVSKTEKHLVLMFFGTGAAEIAEEPAANAILTGINYAASKGVCPPRMTIILYSDNKADTDNERREWLDRTTKIFVTAAKNRGEYNTRQYSSWQTYGSQVLAILIMPLLAALIATYIPRIQSRLWWGPVVTHAIKWSVVSSGFYTAIQVSMDTPSPLQLSVVISLMALGFVAPLWEWMDMSELAKAQDDEESSTQGTRGA